jgi:polyisoprenoid-binding protein YceI
MKNAIPLLTLTVLSTPAGAADQYTIDPRHTYPTIEYTHLGYSTQRIRFDKTNGTIALDGDAKSGTVNIEIDANSINSGFDEFNGHLRGEDFFDVARYPRIIFKSTRLNYDGERVTSAEGELTLKSITKPVTLTVTSFHCGFHPLKMRSACGANATAKLKRSDFELGKHTPLVSDEVTVQIAVEAFKD